MLNADVCVVYVLVKSENADVKRLQLLITTCNC